MRFNNKELCQLAQQSSENFVKEGCLMMRDKQDGLFKKGEIFVERYFRLRGNLLFYFKSKEMKSDPLGVLVLERCTIELVVNDEKGNSFMIVYEGDDYAYRFAAKDEDERDCWIQALHIASYECLKMQLQSLREQLQARTGRDPISQTMPTETDMEFETGAGNTEEDPAIEVSLSCENLPNDGNGNPPNPFVALYTIIPPAQTTWIQHNHTEVSEKNNSPVFLKTIGFGDMAHGVDTCTRVKMTVYNVKERMTGTMSQIGQGIMTLQNVLSTKEMTLKIKLQGPDPLDCGHITVKAWLNDANLAICELKNGKIVTGDDSLSPKAMRRRSKRVDTLRPMYNNIVTRTFRFDTSNDGVKLLVHEYMGESKFTFDIPSQLLKLWVDEEENNISQLHELGQISYEIQGVCQEAQDYCMTRETLYSQQIKHLTSYKGPNFKASVKKSDKQLEFIPINLHLQRMTVINESKNTTGWYDNITVGAFTAYAQKYKNGGLHRMLRHLKNTYNQDSTLGGATKVQKACNLVNDVCKLKGEIIHCCDSLCHMAMSGTPEDFQKAMDILAEKVKELVSICDTKILQDAAEKYSQSKSEVLPVSKPTPGLRKSDIPIPSPPSDDLSPEKTWRWSGTNFVKSPTVEPWEMTRLNTEAAVVCLVSMVEELITNRNGPMDRPKWLNEISPAVIKLKSFVELVHQRVLLFMTYLNLMEHKGNIRFIHMIKYRRDICFSHALTSLVTGFVTRISTCMKDEGFFNQLLNVGVLAQFEGLLSCQGDEMGMIEDFVVAASDLNHVTFQFCPLSEEMSSPTVSLDSLIKDGEYPDFFRHHVCVSIPLEEEILNRLPDGLQKGHKVQVTSVFFNIGINEQASLAERFGDTSLQERINAESVAKVFSYVEKYQETVGDPDNGKSGPGTIKELCKKLHYNTMEKKSKNTEILKLAAEICRKIKGIRFTSCKSAKDRTAMAVTLEQVYILQQEHDLASHVFTQALDCFRSEGVRRENTLKNVGAKKYAFNSLQLLYIPKLYRPPNGTYGNVQG